MLKGKKKKVYVAKIGDTGEKRKPQSYEYIELNHMNIFFQ